MGKRRCRDCAFFSLACEGLEGDRCRFFNRFLSRTETLVKTDCPEYVVREDEKDVEFYIPERMERKEIYEREIRKYSLYMIILVVLGIGFFYLVTAAVSS
jgi:hypothetical protein